MTVSVWRYCHMALALISSIFLVLASLTGFILSFEPMGDALQPYDAGDLEEISLAQTMSVMQEVYQEVITLEVDKNDFVLASVVNKDGSSETVFVHPLTGKKLGKPKEKAKIFQFTTNLHRSLFLKSMGRFFVGTISFLLCLIAITGFLLLIQRQGGIAKLFSKVQKEGFELYYHVSLGRWMLLPILLVAATGVYLSLEKFSLLPSMQLKHQLPASISETMTENPTWELPIFENTKLNEVRKLTYPFSEFPEDYYELALRDKEILIHQYTGEFLSERAYPFTAIASRYSMLLHTGQGSLLWSIILALVSLALLFFIYSGIILWRKRIKKSKTNALVKVDKDAAGIIILVGSETGNTFEFAQILQKALMDAGETVFVSELNKYTYYEKVRHLIVLAATYGEGEAPTNARNFHKILPTIQQKKSATYSVVGFGSMIYPEYCGFGVQADKLLKNQDVFEELVPLYKINNQNFRAFQDWGTKWSNKTGIPLALPEPKKKLKQSKSKPFKVVHRSNLNQDDTYVLQLEPLKRAKFQSGDLAGIVPSDGIERLYSIAKMGNYLTLSIKKHQSGVCSTYLSTVSSGDLLPISVRKSHDFHFPKYAKTVIFIANGTGIAPFLGMLDENKGKIPTHLFLGLRNHSSLQLYQEALNKNQPNTLQVAYSREVKKEYVQDVLNKKSAWVAQQLESGAVIMICGSLAMQNQVLEVLEKSCRDYLDKPLSEFENSEQLKMDCY
ncbi:MAG: PepSY domain-containing protein [Bacteroidota bacterium]